MPDATARLLVALRPHDELSAALSRRLVGVPWTYARTEPAGAWDAVEAMLVGSVERELGMFDAGRTPHLQFVQRLYTGLDGFPFDRFPAHVKVAGNVGAYAPFVAEHALALALAAARAIVPVQGQLREHALRPAPEMRLFRGGTAVILGYGEIGRAIAQRVAAFEMRVVGLNRRGQMAAGCDAMFPADHLREAVAEGDVVFDARPLTLTTAATIGRAELEAMPSEGIYVNVGRAGTVDEEALYDHLVAHPSFRAALDVWWEEDFARGTIGSRFPFVELRNFVGTPHCAGLSPVVEPYALDHAIENLGRFFRGEPPRYLADRQDYVPAAPGP